MKNKVIMEVPTDISLNLREPVVKYFYMISLLYFILFPIELWLVKRPNEFRL